MRHRSGVGVGTSVPDWDKGTLNCSSFRAKNCSRKPRNYQRLLISYTVILESWNRPAFVAKLTRKRTSCRSYSLELSSAHRLALWQTCPSVCPVSVTRQKTLSRAGFQTQEPPEVEKLTKETPFLLLTIYWFCGGKVCDRFCLEFALANMLGFLSLLTESSSDDCLNTSLFIRRILPSPECPCLPGEKLELVAGRHSGKEGVLDKQTWGRARAHSAGRVVSSVPWLTLSLIPLWEHYPLEYQTSPFGYFYDLEN